MRSLNFIPVAFGLLCGSVVGEVTEFYFPSEKEDWLCPGTGFKCEPPAVCSRDTLTDRYYCCEPDRSGMCWRGHTDCSGGNDTTPGTGQLGCGGVFCCLDKRCVFSKFLLAQCCLIGMKGELWKSVKILTEYQGRMHAKRGPDQHLLGYTGEPHVQLHP